MAFRTKAEVEKDTNYVVIYRSTDTLEAQMLYEALWQDGIAARYLGTRDGAAIGVGQLILEQRLAVPEIDVPEATALIDALRNATFTFDEDEES